MQIKMPKELLKYVRMSKGKLIHSEDMPDELKPLFEETKKQKVKEQVMSLLF